MFIGALADDARQAIITYLLSRADDDDWADAVEYATFLRRNGWLARARQLAELEAREHVSDGGKERGAGKVEPVERQVDVP